MSQAVAVQNPDFVVVLRAGAQKPVVLQGTALAVVFGGKRFDGNGYKPGVDVGKTFSFGYEAPEKIEFKSKKGQRARLTDVTRVLFCGGTEGAQSVPQVKSKSTVVGDEAYEYQIPDDRQVHLIDNDADVQIADETPVYPGDIQDEVTYADDDGEVQPGEGQNERDTVGADENTGVGGDYWRGGIGEDSPFRDDFVEIMRQQARAAIGPRGEMLDEFHQKWQQQGEVHEALVAEAPFARINPPSVLSGNLGSQAIVDINGPLRLVAMWKGEDAETLPVTVAFGPASLIEPPIAIALPVGMRGFGIVRFGTHGTVAAVEVDATVGCQFTVNASFVSIEVGFDAPAFADLISMQMSGIISFHTAVRTAPVTCTRISSLSMSDTGIKIIPAFSKRLVVWRSDNAAALTVEILDFNGGLLQTTAIAAGAQMTVPVPLSGAAAKFKITNTTVNLAIVSAIFELGI